MTTRSWLDDDPTGHKYIDHIRRHGDTCASLSREKVQQLGLKANDCHEALGMTLSLLDCAAACYWGCAKGDHKVEFLLASTASTAYAAMELLYRGYYDQSLSLARIVGETANLFALFALQPDKLAAWKNAPDHVRKRAFSPVKVRLEIEALGSPVPIDENRYGRLSNFSIHATPNRRPQAHNHRGVVTTLPVFQEKGFLLALNEVALATGYVAYFACHSIELPQSTRETVKEVSRGLLEAIGGIRVDVDGEPWFRS